MLLAQALVMVETKYSPGRAPTWTIFNKMLDEVMQSKMNQSMNIYSFIVLPNVRSM